MKTIRILYVLTAGIGLAQSPAASGWFWQNPLPRANYLSAAVALDSNTVVAVGDGGTILRTTDGGATWPAVSSGTTKWLARVSFTGANTGTVVGEGGTILRTTDSGVTWKAQSSGNHPDRTPPMR